MNTNNGGPAFPCDEWQMKEWSGMTLRDYFAIHSVQPGVAEIVATAGLVYSKFAVWSDPETRIGTFEEWFFSLPLERRYELYSTVKYEMADAMLAARDKALRGEG
jgi:hypothetical protein